MSVARVLIVYEPYMYRDVLSRVISNWQVGEVIDRPSKDVDVIVFPTNAAGQPKLETLPAPVPKAKLIAVSPTGDCAWVCLPDENQWHKFQPFDLGDLCMEVFAGRGRRTATPHAPPQPLDPSRPPQRS
jgi:hypothetical protein